MVLSQSGITEWMG